jgi:hypothetical protein
MLTILRTLINSKSHPPGEVLWKQKTSINTTERFFASPKKRPQAYKFCTNICNTFPENRYYQATTAKMECVNQFFEVKKKRKNKIAHTSLHIQHQGSPHIVKTGRLDFSLSWLKGEVRENLGDFRKSIKILKFQNFISSLPHVPLPFTKRTCCTMILKRMQLTIWNKILNIKPCMGHISGTWKLL